MPDYYAVLGVSPNSTQEEIISAYRNLVRKYHPDRNPNTAALMVEINQAFDAIGSKEKRIAFDAINTGFFSRNLEFEINNIINSQFSLGSFEFLFNMAKSVVHESIKKLAAFKALELIFRNNDHQHAIEFAKSEEIPIELRKKACEWLYSDVDLDRLFRIEKKMEYPEIFRIEAANSIVKKIDNDKLLMKITCDPSHTEYLRILAGKKLVEKWDNLVMLVGLTVDDRIPQEVKDFATEKSQKIMPQVLELTTRISNQKNPQKIRY